MGNIDNWWINTDIRGLRFRVDLDTDQDETPYHADCYTDEQVEAWKNDRWEFVIVTVTPELDGELITECLDSLGGVEAGAIPEAVDGYIGRDQLSEYPVHEMVDACKANLRGKEMTRAINNARNLRRDARRQVKRLRETRRALARA